MSTLHLILVFESGTLCVDGQRLAVTAPGLWLMAGATPPQPLKGVRVLSTPANALQPVVRELQDLLTDGAPRIAPNRPYAVAAEMGLLQAVARLAELDHGAMLRFALAYCLVVDGAACTALLRFLVAPDFALFDFIHRHRLEPWPVARYAEALGLPLRKFNQLFKDKYHMSAKQWLQGQRLEHARALLQETSKKVIEVALESGFCTPAHFSERFRRHFHQSPRDVRRQTRRSPAAVMTPQTQEQPMDLESIQRVIADSTSQAENDVRAAMSKDLTNNTTGLLAAQFALAKYTQAIALQAAVVKDWKDMVQGIIAKI